MKIFESNKDCVILSDDFPGGTLNECTSYKQGTIVGSGTVWQDMFIRELYTQITWLPTYNTRNYILQLNVTSEYL